MKSLITITAALALVLSSCSSQRRVAAPGAPSAASTQVANQSGKMNNLSVLQGQWTATDVAGTAVAGDNRPYVEFDPTGTNDMYKVYAFNGCNTLNGDLRVTADGVMTHVGEMISTMMLCPEVNNEMGVNLALAGVTRYTIKADGNDSVLTMLGADGKALMTLRKTGIDFINGAWRVLNVGDMVFPETVGAQLVIDLPEQRLHGNGGCNVINGKIIINPDVANSIGFADIASTRMMCPEMNYEMALTQALANVASVHRMGSDRAQLFDAAGNPLITLSRVVLK